MKCLSLLFTLAFGLALNAQKTMQEFIINDEVVAAQTVSQLESAYKVKFVPGDSGSDRMTGAFGRKGGPCTGVGCRRAQYWWLTQVQCFRRRYRGIHQWTRPSSPRCGSFQTFMQVIPGRYWMDVYGNFGSENVPYALGNVYQLYQARFGRGGKANSYYKNNPWSGESTSFGGDGSFMYYSSKKTDGTTYEYFSDH